MIVELQVRVRGDAAAAAKRELEAGRAALARGRDELLQSQRALAQAQVSLWQPPALLNLAVP